MAHWAELDENNIVLRVVVTDNNDPAGDEGYSWLVNNLGGRWVQTSYNGNFRKNFAGAGAIYDEELDAFLPIKRFDSWVLNRETIEWEPPIPCIEDDNFYVWSEDTKSWQQIPDPRLLNK